MAPHSSTLAWKIPWMEEPGRVQSTGLLRVWHDWATSFSLFTVMHWRRKWQPTPVFLPGESQGRPSLVGCHLWDHRVGHDWSDLAAAAAVTFDSLLIFTKCMTRCIFSNRVAILVFLAEAQSISLLHPSKGSGESVLHGQDQVDKNVQGSQGQFWLLENSVPWLDLGEFQNKFPPASRSSLFIFF